MQKIIPWRPLMPPRNVKGWKHLLVSQCNMTGAIGYVTGKTYVTPARAPHTWRHILHPWSRKLAFLGRRWVCFQYPLSSSHTGRCIVVLFDKSSETDQEQTNLLWRPGATLTNVSHLFCRKKNLFFKKYVRLRRYEPSETNFERRHSICISALLSSSKQKYLYSDFSAKFNL